ncbi:Hypothetical predicted protein [Mytilus galloprovincialis]|uniref:Uncharacterized protein n=1 Tax=Mytilus galloprovincialis TaxID=29158 RepID=A0A8B6G4T3_MYTGA|nr:Hypothetical predicted protein [Mytilus galloprovincialis]
MQNEFTSVYEVGDLTSEHVVQQNQKRHVLAFIQKFLRLQTRIQSFLYDKNGEPWGKVKQKPKETSGKSENYLLTEELNNLQPEAFNQDDFQVKSPETTRPTDTCHIIFRDNDSDLKFVSKEESESQSVAINQKLTQVNKRSGNVNAKA